VILPEEYEHAGKADGIDVATLKNDLAHV